MEVICPDVNVERNSKDENALNIVTFLNHSEFILEDIPLFNIPESKPSTLNTTTKDRILSRKSIYVCTLCQVFSPSDTALANHIASEHGSSLPAGTTAEDFISKLQALPNEDDKSHPKKVGRPKKADKVQEKETPTTVEEKLPSIEPFPDADGLYWCNKCHKYFKKSRQLSRHICFQIDEDEFMDETSQDSDSTSDFKMYMDVEPIPWHRMQKSRNNLNKSVTEDLHKLTTEKELDGFKKAVFDDQQPNTRPNWRDDPAYVPLFQNQNERQAFEEHLKTIDYSCVDHLIMKEEKKIKGRRKKSCLHSCATVFSCTICKKTLNSLSHIRMHCLTHTDIKPFTCPECSYRTNTKGSLYTHMRIHTGNIFCCSHCDFKSTKRAHLLDHEETHSNVVQYCKLCKNSYKTVRSLIAHVRRYHDNPGGKRYIKSLSSKPIKENSIKCDICQKRFKSKSTFDAHNQSEHTVFTNFTPLESFDAAANSLPEITRMNEELPQVPFEPPSEYDQNEIMTIQNGIQDEIMPIKDPLAEMVLNNLLQQKNMDPIVLLDDVFRQSPDVRRLLSSARGLTENISPDSSSQRLSPMGAHSHFRPPKNNVEECEKTLNLDILDECLRIPNFANEVIDNTCLQDPNIATANHHQTFSLPEMQLPYVNETLMPNDISESNPELSKDLSQLNAEIDKSDLTEPKSAEIKLFEKCRRAPAYVCCVCSGIFICPSTLKAHLKEHINMSNSLNEQDDEEDNDDDDVVEQQKIAETDEAIDSVCRILQDPANSCGDDEKELEKLYSSSLDMIWYLPEVSVVLENDPALIDAVLADISNFPITDTYDETEELLM